MHMSHFMTKAPAGIATDYLVGISHHTHRIARLSAHVSNSIAIAEHVVVVVNTRQNSIFGYAVVFLETDKPMLTIHQRVVITDEVGTPLVSIFFECFHRIGNLNMTAAGVEHRIYRIVDQLFPVLIAIVAYIETAVNHPIYKVNFQRLFLFRFIGIITDIHQSIPIGHFNFVDPVFQRKGFFNDPPTIRIFGSIHAFGSTSVPVWKPQFHFFPFSDIFHHHQVLAFREINTGNIFVITIAVADAELFAQHRRT